MENDSDDSSEKKKRKIKKDDGKMDEKEGKERNDMSVWPKSLSVHTDFICEGLIFFVVSCISTLSFLIESLELIVLPLPQVRHFCTFTCDDGSLA